jgi:hypothetical protein
MKRVTTSAYIILLPVLLFLTLRLQAQVPSSGDLTSRLKRDLQDSLWEEMYLHIDRDKYIAGEDIWFSIYNLDIKTGSLTDKSSVAYIELLNPWNIPVIQKRFQLSNGIGEGNILLPDSISSGTYTVRAYTNRMKNFLPENCFMYDIEILNPFRNSRFIRKAASFNNLNIKTLNNSKDYGSAVTLVADTIYGRREKVTLKIRTDGSDKELSGIYEMSISISPARTCAHMPGIEDYLPGKKAEWLDRVSGITALPQYNFEGNGHYLSVKIKYRNDNTPDTSDFLFMSTQGKVAEFRYAGRDTTGRFNFILPADNKLRNLIIQPEHATNNMILEIEPSFSWILPVSHCFTDTLTDSQLDIFSELSFNYQAAKIYGTSLKKEIVTNDESNQKKRRFYGIPEIEIKLSDYIMLPTIQEVFFELIPGVIIREGKSGYEMKITNPLTGVYYNEPPLVMIDGVIINDLSVLIDLNPESVEKVEVVKTPYLIGDLILHGIVNVITRSGNFSNITMPDFAVLLPYRVIDKSYTISLPDYSADKNRLSRKPDLRNTLYWNPSVKTEINGEAEIEFWTSDLPGIYTINIQGISTTGKKVSLQKSFSVR